VAQRSSHVPAAIVTKRRARPSDARIEEIAAPAGDELRLIRDAVDPHAMYRWKRKQVFRFFFPPLRYVA
jgi:hypothetical protein